MLMWLIVGFLFLKKKKKKKKKKKYIYIYIYDDKCKNIDLKYIYSYHPKEEYKMYKSK